MTRRGRAVGWISALAAVALIAPATAWGHAALLRTSPSASGVINGSPGRVSMTYSEAVEPKFAVVSVTDAAGHSQVAGTPRRSPANPDQLDVPLRHLDKGWYLVDKATGRDYRSWVYCGSIPRPIMNRLQRCSATRWPRSAMSMGNASASTSGWPRATLGGSQNWRKR